MTPAQRQTDALIDALAFAFVSVAVQQLHVRPCPAAIARFRDMAAAALERFAAGPFGSDEPTEPGTGTRSR